MLLKRNFSTLKQLGLSQTIFPLARSMFANSERFANNLQQLRFLHCCKKSNTLPTTIRNIRLPNFYSNDKYANKKYKIQQTILNSTIRHVRSEVAKRKLLMTTQNMNLLELVSQNEAATIINKCKEAYHVARIYHRNRTQKKIDRITTNMTPKVKQANNKQCLVTDLTNTLSTDEINLLAKGPKFAVKEKPSSKTRDHIQASYCKLAYNIRWKEHIDRSHQPDQRQFPRPKETSYFSLPPIASNETEQKLKKAFCEIQLATQNITRVKPDLNLSKKEASIIKDLKSKNCIYLPSDKGTEFCAIQTDRYIEAGLIHLSDSRTYKQIPRMSAATIERKVNKEWKSIAAELGLPKHIVRSLTTNNSEIPRFYHLIKTHKTGAGLKIRPIVSNSGGPTRKMSWLISSILTPNLERIQAHLKDSDQLIKQLKLLPHHTKLKFSYPFSLDVVALYTSIPPQEAINAALEFIREHNFGTFRLTTSHLYRLMQIVVKNTYFQFNGQIYLQTSGLAMGSSASAALATIYMNKIEQQIVHQLNVGLYFRYVDDCCVLTTSKEEADTILSQMNSVNSYIQFEIEHPNNNNAISLLDFTLTIDEVTKTHSIDFYKKEAKKNLFVHFTSALPISNKANYVRNELKRITNRCDNSADRRHNIEKFADVLRLNDYPEEFISRHLNQNNEIKSRNRNKNKPYRKPKFYFEFPYLNDKLDSQINAIFRKNNLDVRIYRRPTSLRTILKKKIGPERQCTKPECTVNDSKLCYRKMCVYSIRCTKCAQIYIGSTIRRLHIRVDEHMKNVESSVHRHAQQCQADFIFQVIDSAHDIVKLRFLESQHIRNIKPLINSKEETSELNHLMF